MDYISTRGQAPILDFKGVTLAGLARDGGLYVPQTFPKFSAEEISAMKGLSYAEVAYHVMRPFVAASMSDDALKHLIEETYGDAFRDDAVAPLMQLKDKHYLLELFHGPTLAFKDFALQALGRFFDAFNGADAKSLTIVGATSGDTGSAAIEGCRGRDSIRIYMLHPKGRVSDVQRKQMTTVLEDNVTNVAVEGTFDDCQNMVKALFNDLTFRDAVGLTAVNSINWARVMAQIVYYFTAALNVGAPQTPVAFSVPTGNFGDIYAGYIAKHMGLPIERLIIATNSNDILARALESGRYERGKVYATLSPSMDIQISSNFERLLFDLMGRDASKVQELMNNLNETGGFTLPKEALATLRETFRAGRLDDAGTSDIIRAEYNRSGMLLDPHTAVGLGVAYEQAADLTCPVITLATAHPAKFGDAVKTATGEIAQLPAHMADLYDREERMTIIDNDIEALKGLIV